MRLNEIIEKYGDIEVGDGFLKLLYIPKTVIYKPQLGEKYWFELYGKPDKQTFLDDSTDDIILKTKRVFRTKEECQFDIDKNSFLIKMELDFELNSEPIDWSNNAQYKYRICFDHKRTKISTLTVANFQELGACTTNLFWLNQYIKDNEANLKKYYFKIKD